MNQPNALFVYGSLQPGAENDSYLKHIKGTWKQGYVLGNLVTEGWGSQIGFPALRVNDQGDQIKGWLLESNDLSNNWKMLDEFEGQEYKRTVVHVHVNDGTKINACIYELADQDE